MEHRVVHNLNNSEVTSNNKNVARSILKTIMIIHEARRELIGSL